MNRQEWHEFSEQTKTEQGAIVACDVIVSQFLLDDTDFDSAAYLAHKFEQSARAFYVRDDCKYTYLSPREYEYNPGPFAYRYTPGDLPPGTVLMVGRVRVRCLTIVVE